MEVGLYIGLTIRPTCFTAPGIPSPGFIKRTLLLAVGSGWRGALPSRNISLASLWHFPKPPASLDNIIIKFSCSIVKVLGYTRSLVAYRLSLSPFLSHLDWHTIRFSWLWVGGALGGGQWQRLNINRLLLARAGFPRSTLALRAS